MSLFKSYTPIFKDEKGDMIPDSISEIDMVSIGNTKQAIVIRGENVNNPVLLIIHGGPGSPETGLFRYFNYPLEKHFVVVYWDQRACGKSYTKQTANECLSVGIYVKDVLDLTLYLRKRLKKEKIFLLCHSWGTLIGMLAVSQHPELYNAYAGVGQVANMPRGELESYRYVLNAAIRKHNQKAIRELNMIGEPQDGIYKCGIQGTKTERKWLTYFGGSVYGSKSWVGTVAKNLFTKEYNPIDIIHFFKGMNAPARNAMSQNEFLHINLSEAVKSLEVPIYFFLGRHDYQVPSIIAEEYFHIIQAPVKKIFWFEDSAHTPCFEEPNKFNKLVIEMLSDINAGISEMEVRL